MAGLVLFQHQLKENLKKLKDHLGSVSGQQKLVYFRAGHYYTVNELHAQNS